VRYYSKNEFDYEYKGFYYCPEEEYEEDNRKTFHAIKVLKPNRCLHYEGENLPLSPYSYASKELFEKWIDMGRPTREMLGDHHKEHHEAYYNKWVLEQLEKELEL